METRRREQTEKSPVVMEVSVREYLSNNGSLPLIKPQWEYRGLIKRLSRMPRMIVCGVCVCGFFHWVPRLSAAVSAVLNWRGT